MYSFKDKYTIDFTDVRYYLQMHKVIKDSLDFPDHYGENWDAFWDCLTDMVGRPIHIEIIGIDTIAKLFPGEDTIMLELFSDLKHHNNDKYISEIRIEIHQNGKRFFLE